ncbi:toll-like receptor 2 [Spea bombifrons]|uniref:toll-like receptor 2 n=1 Tax=Spea bombifrons TaxID=233779 RepID=UPI00234BAC1D|nr:toll-like receptor 2 [Spea bombifrons]
METPEDAPETTVPEPPSCDVSVHSTQHVTATDMFHPAGTSLSLLLVAIALVEGTCVVDQEGKVANCKGLQLHRVPLTLPRDVEVLDLSYNRLRNIRTGDFYAYAKLRSLDLSFNNISTIDNDSFASNVHLRNLSLFNNTLSEMPSLLLEPLKYLEVLDMSNNFYTYATLGNVFKNLVNLKDLSIGGPLIPTILKGDFAPIKDIALNRFALKTKSSLEGYEVGAFSAVNTSVLWFDMALDNHAQALPLILKDLAGKSFNTIRFRNLFEFTYYMEGADIFSGLAHVHTHELVFFRGKFNEYLLRLVLGNVQMSSIRNLLLLSIDFARSPNSNWTDARIEDLSLNNLVIKDVTNPDILRFDWTFTWFSKIVNLHIINVNFNFVPCDAWGQMGNVEALNISENRLLGTYLYNPRCNYKMLPRITTFNASNNLLDSLNTVSLLTASWIKLSVVDLSFNRIGGLREVCTWTPTITSMSLKGNLLQVNVFLCLPLTLQYLDMSNSHLDRLDMTYFNRALDLRELILSNNKIKFIPSGWKSPNLRVLALEGNSFGVIDKGSFQHLYRLEHLSAGNNPYHCTCDLHAFIRETLSDSNLSLIDWPHGYYCYHPEYLLDTKVEHYSPSQLQCDVRLVVAISVSVTAVLVIICMLLCWKFDVPWYLRATCHIIQSKYRSRKNGDSKDYNYHAFISYSCSDADWVRGVLLPRLEGSTPPYSVCIHERDFLPGKWIIDNIIENIENSRKVIFVLSRSFVNSEWCNYELYFAHQRAIGHAFDDVILVVKEDIRLEDLPKKFYRLRKMLNTKTYLEWPPEQNRQQFFWVQLKTILGQANPVSVGQDGLSVVNETTVDVQPEPSAASTSSGSTKIFPGG